ncbi:hypothetical protein SRHO_G00016200 [Serrasalmus rhombeus]
MRRTRSSRAKPASNSDSQAQTVWQWEGDDGQWEPYSSTACAQLDAAVRAGESSVTLQVGPGYEVDLVKMTQTNSVTKYRRKIRSLTVKAEDANGGDGSQLTSTASIKEEEEEAPAAKKRRGRGKSQKENKAKPSEETDSKEVVKTVVMKGKAPVDSECKAKVGKAFVYSEGNDVYDVMLNQTNLQFNNNKYYLIQLLQDNNAKAYSVWMRWGRVGKVGQNSLVSCGGDLARAKDVFRKKFIDKTKNEWEDRANFEKVSGKYDLVFMDYSSNDKVIEKYLQSTHAPTHSDYTMTVLDVFSVDREGERDRFLSQLHNRTLLWHGSRLSNWVGILSQGLRVAPPEAPVTGYMFGKGIYFADMSSKSGNYCFTSQKNNTGLLLLSEVALGDCNELLDANYDADKLPSGTHSTKGLGQTAPDPKNFVTLDGATVPMGPGVKTGVGQGGGYSLLYNEFVVYNPAQTRMRYLLRVRFNYSSLW